MNAKTAKLINKVAKRRAKTFSEINKYRNELKRHWNATIQPERNGLRKELQSEIE